MKARAATSGRLAFALLAAIALSTALSGCSKTEPEAPPAGTGSAANRPDANAAPVADSTPVQSVKGVYGVGDNVYVRALAIDVEANSIWVGTSVGVNEVDLLSHSVINTFTRDHGLANEYVFGIGIDHAGNKWFGTNAGGVSRYRDGVWKTFFPMHGLADYWVYSFASQADGTLWIGTWAGANSVDPRTGAFTTYVRELVNEWVYGIDVDSKDRVWFGTEGGVSMFDGKTWRSWTHADGLGAGNADNLSASKNTGLGTRKRHDLGILRGGEATYNPNYVFAICVDTDDVVWAGTWGGGVSRFDGREWKNYTREDGLSGDIVYSIVQDQEGVLWIGTNAGISRFDGTTWHRYGRREGIPSENIYALAVDPRGHIWAGTNGAAVRLAR